jgi:hypothetical protein
MSQATPRDRTCQQHNTRTLASPVERSGQTVGCTAQKLDPLSQFRDLKGARAGTREASSVEVELPERSGLTAVFADLFWHSAKGQRSTTNSGDMVFSDGTQYEMATLTGNTSSGYTATLTIGISI